MYIFDNIIHIIIHIIKSRSSKCDTSGVALSPQTVIKLIKLLLSDIIGGDGLSPKAPPPWLRHCNVLIINIVLLGL